MSDNRVRSLHDSDAALRRAAQVLRPLGAEEAAARPGTIPPQHVALENDRRASTSGRHDALLAALRRSREVLDMLQRTLSRRQDRSR